MLNNYYGLFEATLFDSELDILKGVLTAFDNVTIEKIESIFGMNEVTINVKDGGVKNYYTLACIINPFNFKVK